MLTLSCKTENTSVAGFVLYSFLFINNLFKFYFILYFFRTYIESDIVGSTFIIHLFDDDTSLTFIEFSSANNFRDIDGIIRLHFHRLIYELSSCILFTHPLTRHL